MNRRSTGGMAGEWRKQGLSEQPLWLAEWGEGAMALPFLGHSIQGFHFSWIASPPCYGLPPSFFLVAKIPRCGPAHPVTSLAFGLVQKAVGTAKKLGIDFALLGSLCGAAQANGEPGTG